MKYIEGEFIMAGCEPSDPIALHTVADCVDLIHRIGFLPLFSNTIPGFSVEEWKKILERLKMNFPEAADEQIIKLLAIKYPGETSAPVKKEKKKAARPTRRKKIRPQELPWPENLMTEIGLDRVFPETAQYNELTDDQMIGLIHAMGTLKDNEQTVIRLRYEEHKTLQETGDCLGLSRERIRQIVAKAVRKLRHPTRIIYYRDGFRGTLEAIEKRKAVARNAMCMTDRVELLDATSVYDAGLTVRTLNCLVRSGLHTLGDVVKLMEHDAMQLQKIRNLGKRSLLEVLERLEEYGVDCNKARAACGFGTGQKEDIAELDLTVRLYNILIRAGLDTVSKVEGVMQKEPEKLIDIAGFGRRTSEELFSKLEAIGIDCSSARSAAERAWR